MISFLWLTIVTYYWASLVSLASANSYGIQYLEAPDTFQRCNISEFKWTGGGPEWDVNFKAFNTSTEFNWSVKTKNNNGFKMVFFVLTGYNFEFSINDVVNSSITSGNWLGVIHEATSDCDVVLSNIDMVVPNPFAHEISTPNPTRNSGDVHPMVMISVGVILLLVVLVLAGCLLFYIRRRRKRRRMPARISVQSQGSGFFPSVVNRFKKPAKSDDFLLEEISPMREEGTPSGGSAPLESTEQLLMVPPRVPEDVNAANLSRPNINIPTGVVIPSSKELRMRGMYGYGYGQSGTGEEYAPSVISNSESWGETFRADTVSVWPTQTDLSVQSESATGQSRSRTSGGSNERRGERRQQGTDPNSLYAIVGQELQHILQEQNANGAPATIRDALTPTSAVNNDGGSPWQTTTSIATTTTGGALEVSPSVTNSPGTLGIPAPVATAGSPTKPPLPVLTIPVSPVVAEPGSAVTPRSGASRKPITRRDMEALTDLVAQRLARTPGRRDPSRYEAPPPSYS